MRLRGRRGFTLIEVIGALVVFSVGVLMVIGVSGASTKQIRYAGITSELTVRASERLDSLEAEPFGALAFGTEVDTITVSGRPYRRTVVLTRLNPLLAEVDIDVEPVDGVGPSYGLASYVGEIW